LTEPQPIVWRIAAAVLWIVSIACLFHAVTAGAATEQALYNQHITDAARLATQRQAEVADRWAAIGWLLQFVTAAVLSFGLNFPRAVRRIFVSLGILIAVDSVTLLLMAVIIR
jgi:hypothetical protein